MVLVTNKKVLDKAKKEGYAVGAFNINNLEFLQAVTETAEKLRSPVIIQATESAIKYAELDYLVNMVHTAGKKIKVPITLHLDHGKDLDLIKKCIKSGFTSVMYDGSSLPYEQNLENTKKVVKWAWGDVSVEAELGTLSGVEDNVSAKKIEYTNPDQAADFVKRTKVDSLAVAIGTSHGAYKFNGDQNLKIDVLKEIAKKINIPLVLHGASGVPQSVVEKANRYGAMIENAKGVPDEQIKMAIKNGISKVNIDTDNRLAFTAGVREFLAKNPKVFDPREILTNAKGEMSKIVEQKIMLFESNGKA